MFYALKSIWIFYIIKYNLLLILNYLFVNLVIYIYIILSESEIFVLIPI